MERLHTLQQDNRLTKVHFKERGDCRHMLRKKKKQIKYRSQKNDTTLK